MLRCVACNRSFYAKWIEERKQFETHCKKCCSYDFNNDGAVQTHQLTNEEALGGPIKVDPMNKM